MSSYLAAGAHDRWYDEGDEGRRRGVRRSSTKDRLVLGAIRRQGIPMPAAAAAPAKLGLGCGSYAVSHHKLDYLEEDL